MKTGKLNIKKFSAAEYNEQIIRTITKTLNNFCYGEYMDEPNYPIGKSGDTDHLNPVQTDHPKLTAI